MRYLFTPILLLVLTISSAQFPCENGLANGLYPCNQVTLLAHLPPEELLATLHQGFYLNDIWGWTDSLTGKEYALVGLKDGISFVEVTNPTKPIVLGKLPEPSGSASRTSGIQHGEKSTWRDIKVYNDHAFIVSDLNRDHGLQVFDLTKLRGLTAPIDGFFTDDARYDAFGSAHNIVINEATGFAYVVGISYGRTHCLGGLHVVNIQDPKNPVFVGCFDTDGYTHDAQCVTYAGPDPDYQGKEICFNSNEDTFTVVDVEDKNDMAMISRSGYENWEYSHQGWASEDHRYFLLNDELDELRAGGFNPRTLIWDIEDLDAPVLIGEYYNNATAIDHNLYTHQNLVYESNYFSGLRILDMDSIHRGLLREIAFFDTYPASDEINFGGTWSNYPYFKSGTIVVSDMNNGLFLLKLDLKDEVISQHPKSQEICLGQPITFEVGAAAEGLSFQWQSFSGINYEDLSESTDFQGVNSPSLSVVPSRLLATRQYRCKISDGSGNLFYTYTANFEVVGEFAVPNFTFSIGTDGMVTFTNQSTGAAVIEWDLGDGNLSSEDNPIHTYEEGAEYTVVLRTTNDCGTTELAKTINVIACGASDLPTSEFIIEGGLGGSYDFVNQSENAESYLWNFGDGNTSDEANPSHTYENSGTYEVRLEVNNGCGSDLDSNVITYVLLNVDEESKRLRLYPNPGNEVVNVAVQENGALELIDLSGKTIYNLLITKGAHELNLMPFPEGIYYLRLNTNTESVTKRLIIKRQP